MNKSVVYLFVSIFFLFTSCEYQIGENFVDLGKNQVDSILKGVQFYGFAYHPDEKAYIVENSGVVGCELYVPAGFEVERMIVCLGEMEWESNGTQCDFMLDVDRIPNGSYELSCEVFAKTNNGTVAGQVGAEQYVEKRSWPLKINARTESELPLQHRVNEEGLIEISWEIDESLRTRFDHYQIEFCTVGENINATYIVKRSEFDQCSYVDKHYVGEKGTYKVYAYFKSEADRPFSLGSLYLEQAEPQVRVEYMQKDRVYLSWTYPYRSAVDVVYGSKVVAEKVIDGMAKFSLAGQETGMIELCFSPIGDWGYKNVNYLFDLENYPKR